MYLYAFIWKSNAELICFHFKKWLIFILIKLIIVLQSTIIFCPILNVVSVRSIAFLDLKEAEDIKKRWQEYTEGLYKKKKDPHDPDNHNGVITHLEPDILECKAKWALGSITTNKASGGDGIPVELFQILKDNALKVLHSICQQIWKTQQWPQDWKRFSFQSQRKAMPKNVQTTTQLHSSHMLVK